MGRLTVSSLFDRPQSRPLRMHDESTSHFSPPAGRIALDLGDQDGFGECPEMLIEKLGEFMTRDGWRCTWRESSRWHPGETRQNDKARGAAVGGNLTFAMTHPPATTVIRSTTDGPGIDHAGGSEQPATQEGFGPRRLA